MTADVAVRGLRGDATPRASAGGGAPTGGTDLSYIQVVNTILGITGRLAG